VSFWRTSNGMDQKGRASMLLVLALVLSSGCVATTPTPEPVTISFAHDAAQSERWEELASAFSKEFPHITVDLKPQRNQGQSSRLYTSEEVVDTFELAPLLFATLFEEGHLHDLSPFVEQDKAFDVPDFYPSLVDMVRPQGAIVAIPAAVEPGGILYNRDLFDRYGVPYPQDGWTWQDFRNTAMSLRDPDAQVFGFVPQILDPIYFGYVPHWIDPLYFVYQNGGRIFDDWHAPTRTTFDDPLTVEAVDAYVRLIHEYGVAPTRSEARQAFSGEDRGVYGYILDRAGMMYGGMFSRFPRPGRNKAVNQGVVAPPHGAQSATFCISTVYAISVRSAHPEASWQWISFLSRQMPSEGMPARRSLAASDAFETAVGEQVAAAARAAMQSDLVLPFFLEERRLEAIEVFHQAVMDACEQVATPEEALGTAQQASRFQ
jgi:multiple sugar transport system substrate-binding protein